MAGFVRGDVVVVPFPFSDLTNAKRRPALVLAKLDGEMRDTSPFPGRKHVNMAAKAGPQYNVQPDRRAGVTPVFGSRLTAARRTRAVCSSQWQTRKACARACSL
jgi:hypothetical protein